MRAERLNLSIFASKKLCGRQTEIVSGIPHYAYTWPLSKIHSEEEWISFAAFRTKYQHFGDENGLKSQTCAELLEYIHQISRIDELVILKNNFVISVEETQRRVRSHSVHRAQLFGQRVDALLISRRFKGKSVPPEVDIFFVLRVQRHKIIVSVEQFNHR